MFSIFINFCIDEHSGKKVDAVERIQCEKFVVRHTKLIPSPFQNCANHSKGFVGVITRRRRLSGRARRSHDWPAIGTAKQSTLFSDGCRGEHLANQVERNCSAIGKLSCARVSWIACRGSRWSFHLPVGQGRNLMPNAPSWFIAARNYGFARNRFCFNWKLFYFIFVSSGLFHLLNFMISFRRIPKQL